MKSCVPTSQAGHVTEKFIQRDGPSWRRACKVPLEFIFFKLRILWILWLLKAKKNVDRCCLKVIWNLYSINCLCKCCFKRLFVRVNLERTVAMFEFVFAVGVCCRVC